MKRVLVDSSAVIAVVRNEPSRPAVLRATTGCAVVAAASLPFEICNALTAAMKQRRASAAQAGLALYEAMPIGLLPVDIGRSLALAARHNIYAYDAFVLSSAQAAALPLLTLNRRMREVATAEQIALEVL